MHASIVIIWQFLFNFLPSASNPIQLETSSIHTEFYFFLQNTVYGSLKHFSIFRTIGNVFEVHVISFKMIYRDKLPDVTMINRCGSVSFFFFNGKSWRISFIYTLGPYQVLSFFFNKKSNWILRQESGTVWRCFSGQSFIINLVLNGQCNLWGILADYCSCGSLTLHFKYEHTIFQNYSIIMFVFESCLTYLSLVWHLYNLTALLIVIM